MVESGVNRQAFLSDCTADILFLHLEETLKAKKKLQRLTPKYMAYLFQKDTRGK
jgi:hypothetical protein